MCWSDHVGIMIHTNFLASAVVSEGEEVSSYVCGESVPQSLLVGNQVSSSKQYMICEPATRVPNSYSPNSLSSSSLTEDS